MVTLSLTLVHFVWEGAAIALLLAVLLQVFRWSPARLRYALACAALFAMPIVFGITFLLSLPPERSAPPPIASVSPIVPIGDSQVASIATARTSIPNLASLWMAGVACLYAYRLLAWISVQRLRRVGVPAAGVWQQRLSGLAERMGYRNQWSFWNPA